MEGDWECYAYVRVIVKLVHGGVDGLVLCGVEIVRMEVSGGWVMPKGCSIWVPIWSEGNKEKKFLHKLGDKFLWFLFSLL